MTHKQFSLAGLVLLAGFATTATAHGQIITGGYVNPFTGGYYQGTQVFNPWTGIYQGGATEYNPFLNQIHSAREFYNPWTGIRGEYRTVVNPWTGQYQYRYGYRRW